MRTAVLPCVLLAAGALSAQAVYPAVYSLAASGMCFDQARDRLVCHQGVRSWEWDAQSGRWGVVACEPSVALSHSVYFPPLGRIVGTRYAVLAAFDGVAYEVLDHLPFGIPLGPLHFDSRTGHLLSMPTAGFTSQAVFSAWSSAGWTTLPSVPAQGLVPSVAFDDARGVFVASVWVVPGSYAWETWEWDGTAWTLRDSSTQERGSLTFDPVTRRVLAVGSSATWSWDGAGWTRLTTTRQPPAGRFGVLTSPDPAHGRLWLRCHDRESRHRIWFWDGTDWDSIAGPFPPESESHLLTFDEARARAVLYDGATHHEWDGRGWTECPAAGGPPQRRLYAQVYDVARRNTLVFGGHVRGSMLSLLGDTWTWDGATWRQASAGGPSARRSAACAFDRGRQRVILLGGYSGGGLQADHWEWDGTSWTLVSANTPMGPVLGAAGCDRVRQRIVFVGSDYRTWEYDGASWSLAATGWRPSGRSLAWDGLRQALVGSVGTSMGNPVIHSWDGQQWNPTGTPNGLCCHDPARGEMLTYTDSILYKETPFLARTAFFGERCGGFAIATTLTTFRRPVTGEDGFQLELRAEATLRPALVSFATTETSLPLGNGCALLLQDPFASRVWFTDDRGLMHIPLPIPDVPALRGIALRAQGAVLDPASPGSLALTQGVRFVIGD